MAFIWIALVYVIVAFTDITAASFVAGTEELRAGTRTFHAGGAVAAASVLYLVLSIVLGLVDRYPQAATLAVDRDLRPRRLRALLGRHASLADYFVLDQRTWAVAILVYCCAASVAPVWALLQPRGYLGGFVLYAALGIGLIGVLFGGYEIRQPAFTVSRRSGADAARAACFPLPLRHHRLRRLLRISRAGLLGDHVEADRPRVARRTRSATARCWPKVSSP